MDESSQTVTPRFDKKKRCVSRESLLEQAEKMMNDLANTRAILEVHYQDEVMSLSLPPSFHPPPLTSSTPLIPSSLSLTATCPSPTWCRLERVWDPRWSSTHWCLTSCSVRTSCFGGGTLAPCLEPTRVRVCVCLH